MTTKNITSLDATLANIDDPQVVEALLKTLRNRKRALNPRGDAWHEEADKHAADAVTQIREGFIAAVTRADGSFKSDRYILRVLAGIRDGLKAETPAEMWEKRKAQREEAAAKKAAKERAEANAVAAGGKVTKSKK